MPSDLMRQRKSRHRRINQAYERVVKQDVKYRFVVDMSSLKG
jgi:D-arabinose 1-dehydrogenase-like Zn-dependent alcohol dehydrogenase